MGQILPKTRIIPISDFYTRLQLEYLSYKFRSLIYHRPFDKKKFIEICEKKKQKIEQIALENRLPSIFNNEDQKRKYLLRFFGDNSVPAFCYRDDYQSNVKGYWDLFYYFIEGSSVRCETNGKIEIGKIAANNIQEKTLVVQVDKTKISVEYSAATRIFPSTFFEELFL